MHSSAMRIGAKFLTNYFSQDMRSILEIGSYDVNGSLRQAQPKGSEWVGIDIEDGPGVDIVVDPLDELPFPEGYFDLVIATSVFEHDPEFWKTLEKMARALKDTGFLFVCAPSNGPVHRYPMDCFRFYPDASQSFLKVIQGVSPGARLVESFVGDQDHEGMWNDFVAVYGMQSSKSARIERIFTSEKCSNVWDGETFLTQTLIETPEDQRNYQVLTNSMSEADQAHQLAITNFVQQLDALTSERDALTSERDALTSERDALTSERDAILSTISWRWTRPIRGLRRILARGLRFGRVLVRKL